MSDSSNSWVTRSVFAIDLPLSGVVDTLLVPFDLAFAQRHAYQAEEERRSSVGATAPSLSDAAVSGRYVPATF